MMKLSKKEERPNPDLADVVVDWMLDLSCNYRCHYCWFDSQWDDAGRLPARSTELVLARWREFFQRFGRAHIQFSGGEPTVRPDLIELLTGLQVHHTMNICTNLSRSADYWRSFTEQVSPSRCTMDVSYHPQFSKPEPFLANLEVLMQRGFFVKAVCVGYPSHLEHLKDIAMGARTRKAHFRVQPFNGRYAGRVYPEAYSDQEKQLIREVNSGNDQADERYRGLDQDIQIQTEYFFHDKKVSGRFCWAGKKFLAIKLDGTIRRCHTMVDDYLGNFYEGDFRLFDEPGVCHSDTCHCDWKWIVDERASYLERKGYTAVAQGGRR